MSTICYCFGVTKEQIEERLAAGETLDTIRVTTGMGAACGGCTRVAERVWGDESTPESRKLILDALARQSSRGQ